MLPPCGELAMRHPQPLSTPISGPVAPPPLPPPPPAPVALPEPVVALPLAEPVPLELAIDVGVQTPAMHCPPGHGVPSAFSGLEHAPVAASQLPGSWQSSGAGQTTGAPRHSPA